MAVLKQLAKRRFEIKEKKIKVTFQKIKKNSDQKKNKPNKIHW